MEEEVEEASSDDEEYEYEVSLSHDPILKSNIRHLNDGKYTDVIHNLKRYCIVDQILSIMC